MAPGGGAPSAHPRPSPAQGAHLCAQATASTPKGVPAHRTKGRATSFASKNKAWHQFLPLPGRWPPMGLLAASGRHSLTSLLRAVGGAKDSMSCPLFTSSPGNPAGPSPGGDRGPAGDRWTARRSVVWATQRWPGAGGTAHRLGASTGTGAALPRGGRARDEPHACQIIYVRPSAAGNSVAKCDQFCGSGRGGRPRFVRWLCRGRAGVYCTPLQIGKLSPTGDKCVAGSREEKRAFSWCNSVLLSIRFS